MLATILLVACTGDPYRNVYEGIKNNNDAKKTPTERATSPTPSYEQYKKERENKL